MSVHSPVASLVAEPHGAARTGILNRMAALLRGVTRTRTRSLQCVETLQLGPKRSLYLVECDGQRFLVGSGNNSIHALVPLPQQVKPAGTVDAGDTP